MKNYFLYRLRVTGVTRWKYVREQHIDDITTKSVCCTAAPCIPNFPVIIYTKTYGRIMSEFDYDATLFPGLTRFGTTEGQKEVFRLQWNGTDYILHIQGYSPILVTGKETLSFKQNDIEIARITPVSNRPMTDDFIQADAMKQLSIQSEFLPILEIIAAVIELRFAL